MEEAIPHKKINWKLIYALVIGALIAQVFIYYLVTVYFK